VKKYRRIQIATALANVKKVVLRVFMYGECAISAQLPETRDSWSGLQPGSMLPNVTLNKEWHLRPGPDKRHVPQENV
jgi:hypothetical protein